MSTVNIDGKTYVVDDLSDATKKLLTIHSKWSDELADVRIEAAKLEAAMRDLTREIIEAVNS